MKLKVIFVISIFILALALASFLMVRMYKDSTRIKVVSNNQETKSNADDLKVVPQTPKDRITVASAALAKNGFLVVRQMDEGKLSQIVEMSSPLNVGVHKDIQIFLGNADLSKSELVVMIYEDYANDGIFNDLDMPALDQNGNMTARYVSTGMPLPTSITEGESSGMVHTMAGMKNMAKVRYTDKGFIPEKVDVLVGSTVEFINESSTGMWVASIPHPQHTKLPTFDQFRLYKKGAKYRYVFDKKGTWEYHDHINPARGGIVQVN